MGDCLAHVCSLIVWRMCQSWREEGKGKGKGKGKRKRKRKGKRKRKRKRKRKGEVAELDG